MAGPLTPLLAGAISAIRGGATLSRVIRVGRRIFRVLDASSPQQTLIPYIDKAALKNSISQIERSYKLLGQTPEKTLIKHMRNGYSNLAADLAEITPPIAKGADALEKRIERDVNMVFRPLEEIPFGELVMANNFSAASQYNIELTNDALTKAVAAGNWNIVRDAFARNGWSRTDKTNVSVVSKPSAKLHRMGISKSGKVVRQFHVAGGLSYSQQAIKNYADGVKKNIGKMAGGWVKCYVGLGGSGRNIPLNYAKIGSGDYYVKGGKDGSVSIRNRLGNFNGFLTKRRSYVMNKTARANLKVFGGIIVDIKKQAKILRLS